MLQCVEYTKSEGGVLLFVSYTIDDEGQEKFQKRIASESEFEAFIPPSHEVDTARHLLKVQQEPVQTRPRRITLRFQSERIDWTCPGAEANSFRSEDSDRNWDDDGD